MVNLLLYFDSLILLTCIFLEMHIQENRYRAFCKKILLAVSSCQGCIHFNFCSCVRPLVLHRKYLRKAGHTLVDFRKYIHTNVFRMFDDCFFFFSKYFKFQFAFNVQFWNEYNFLTKIQIHCWKFETFLPSSFDFFFFLLLYLEFNVTLTPLIIRKSNKLSFKKI